LADCFDHFLGRHPAQYLCQRPIATNRDIILDAGGINQAVEVQHMAGLPGIEGNLMVVHNLFACDGVCVQQTLNDLIPCYSLMDDVGHVLKLDRLVKNALRLYDHHRSLLTESVTAGHPHICFNVLPSNLGSQGVNHFLAAVDTTAGAPADSDAGSTGVTAGDDGFPSGFQVRWGVHPFA
jgi:hypothetical protein